MIPDYLVEKGVWWKEVDDCIEFFDHSGDVNSQLKTTFSVNDNMWCGKISF